MTLCYNVNAPQITFNLSFFSKAVVILEVYLGSLSHLFPKHNLWIWRWARALNFFGRSWLGLFWVDPVLLNRCMILATVLQLSFRVLAIFL